jgi:hypothetical protein
MTGVPLTRNELAAGTLKERGVRKPQPVSVTTVNRVVQVLEQEGCVISRDREGREVVFQLRHVGTPKRAVSFPNLAEQATFTRIELVGSQFVVDFAVGKRHFRGISDNLTAPPIGKAATVKAIELHDNNTAGVTLVHQDTEYVIRHVQNISAM